MNSEKPSQNEKNRFCRICGAELRFGAEFCTQCGGYMAPVNEQKIHKDFIAEKSAQPSTVAEQSLIIHVPPNQPRKRQTMKKILRFLIGFLCVIIIMAAIIYAFFKPYAYLMTARYYEWRGDIFTALEWYESLIAKSAQAGDIKGSSRWSNLAGRGKARIVQGVLRKYTDKMFDEEWTADLEIAKHNRGNIEKYSGKLFYKPSGILRIEIDTFRQGAKVPILLSILNEDTVYNVEYLQGKNPSTNKIERTKWSRECFSKEWREKSHVGVFMYLSKPTEKIDDVECYVYQGLTPIAEGFDGRTFLAVLGVSWYDLSENTRSRHGEMSITSEKTIDSKMYFGAEDGLLHLTVLGKDDQTLTEFRLINIEIGVKNNSDKFTIPASK